MPKGNVFLIYIADLPANRISISARRHGTYINVGPRRRPQLPIRGGRALV